jgi:phage N-6-adenine-methyltransferase
MTEHYASSKSAEWYTPARYIEAARAVMGGIDLDPATCPAAQKTVQAARHYTAADNGLAQPWAGRVFLNPPYGRGEGGRSNQAIWSAKLVEEWRAGRVVEAVLLVTAATSEKWFKPLWNYPICLTDHRIAFIGPDGQPIRGNTKGSAFVYLARLDYLGRELGVGKFAAEFQKFGPIVRRVYP